MLSVTPSGQRADDWIRTSIKRVILEIYDAMAEAIRTGQPYQTRLDPPPGPPTDAEGNFIPVANWNQSNWPPHIHPPRDATEGNSGSCRDDQIEASKNE